jgi:hypothetical protein
MGFYLEPDNMIWQLQKIKVRLSHLQITQS